MEKSSPKFPAMIEPNDLGCLWRFSGMFGFHQSRPNQKLLLNESHGIKTLTEAGYARSQAKMLTDFDEKCEGINIGPKKKTLDGGERGVKKFMEKEKTSGKRIKKHKKARKDARIVVHQHPSCSTRVDISSHNEGFCYQIPHKNGRHSSFGKAKRGQRDENNALFPKRLRDESLLVKHILSLRDIQAADENTNPLPESKSSKMNCGQPVYNSMEVCKQTVEKSLWERIKSRYEYPNKKNQNRHHSNRLVVLKPGQKTIQNPVTVGCHCTYLESHKPTLIFFRDVRRKLKIAKVENQNEKKGKAMDLKLSIISEVGSVSESDSKRSNLSSVAYSKQQFELDILVEAKRHLSERLKQVEKGEALSSKQASRTLKSILSYPEPDLLATHSPKRERNYGSVSTQMRFFPYGSLVASEKSLQTRKGKINGPSALNQNEETRAFSDCTKSDDPLQVVDSMVEVHETACFTTDDSSSSGYVEASEQNKIHTTKIRDGNGCLDCLRSELPLENVSLNFSSDISSYKFETMDSDQDKQENPSPVSILKPFFPDSSSPTSTMTESAELSTQPLHLDFEEQSQMSSPLYPIISLSTCMEDKEFISAYVNLVYQTSLLNRDEFLVKSCPMESCYDHKLLYDCIKEVLIDLHQWYYGCSPWKLFGKPQIRPVSLEETVLNEVMKEVDRYILPQTMPPTLDQLVGGDIAKSGKWVDLRVDTEDILNEVVEEALEELIMEVILDIQI